MAFGLDVYLRKCNDLFHYECDKGVCNTEEATEDFLYSEAKQDDVTYYELREGNRVLASFPKYAA